ncbi:hypothetical protein NG798_23160 [Ancylothrix sp. C2]|uniref:hypothetical protein n=1 Tax=Ancylothrix sp. D3o TaxID=2953691 RepID=UPI0021BB0805|nr:hypothetical protein [Ancylothrix sp. D3o]MCT7952703.1 hypothetical protein [Ancylothrix sp. D3o]
MEGSKASVERLTRLILLIAIAYTITSLQGLKIKELGQQKYINRLQEVGRDSKRHSNFWIGQYGFLWIAAMDKWSDLAQELMKNKSVGIAFFSEGTASYNLYSVCLVAFLSPRQVHEFACPQSTSPEIFRSPITPDNKE